MRYFIQEKNNTLGKLMFGENSEREKTREKDFDENSKHGGQNKLSSKFLVSFFGATSLFRGGSRISTFVRHHARERRQRERARVLYIYTLYYIFVEKRETEDKER